MKVAAGQVFIVLLAIFLGVANSFSSQNELIDVLQGDSFPMDPSIVMSDAIEKGWYDGGIELLNQMHKGRFENHKDKISLIVRSKTREVKQEIDHLEKLLNPLWAVPQNVTCPYQFNQNTTHAMVAVRFSKSWLGQSAIWGQRFKTVGGKGSFETNLDDFPLDIEIEEGNVHFKIVGEIGSRRFRYSMDLDLFDAIDLQGSHWEIALRDAHGSMQMSSGAKLPELHLFLRKEYGRIWPRVERVARKDVATETWQEAPAVASGVVGESSEESVLTCAPNAYCPMADMCVKECTKCPESRKKATSHKQGSPFLLCDRVGKPEMIDNFKMADLNMEKGVISGEAQWMYEHSFGMSHFEVSSSGSNKNEKIKVMISDGKIVDGRFPVFTVPLGNMQVPATVSVVAVDKHGASSHIFEATVQDKFRPVASPQKIKAIDNNPERMKIDLVTGFLGAEDEEFVDQYVMYIFDRRKPDEKQFIRRFNKGEQYQSQFQLERKEGMSSRDIRVQVLSSYMGVEQLGDGILAAVDDVGMPDSPSNVKFSIDSNPAEGVVTLSISCDVYNDVSLKLMVGNSKKKELVVDFENSGRREFDEDAEIIDQISELSIENSLDETINARHFFIKDVAIPEGKNVHFYLIAYNDKGDSKPIAQLVKDLIK